MWDKTVPMISLAMRAASLQDIPVFNLPAPYAWRFYQPGDERFWAQIETSAGEFVRPEDGLARFPDIFNGKKLEERMIFLTEGGAPFATATAWHAGEGEGLLHWVSVDAAHQGRGLSRVLVSLAMRRLRELGYASAFLRTQTASWVAIKVYARFGFRPVLRARPDEEAGWRIVSEKTGIDFMRLLQTRG